MHGSGEVIGVRCVQGHNIAPPFDDLLDLSQLWQELRSGEIPERAYHCGFWADIPSISEFVLIVTLNPNPNCTFTICFISYHD